MKPPAFAPIRSSLGTGLNQPTATPSGAVSEDLLHELRQPLSVIETLAYYLELTASDEKISQHAQQIQAMVSKANRILASTSSTASPAKPLTVVLRRSNAS